MKKIKEIAKFVFVSILTLFIAMPLYAFAYVLLKKSGNDEELEDMIEQKNWIFGLMKKRFLEIFKVNAL